MKEKSITKKLIFGFIVVLMLLLAAFAFFPNTQITVFAGANDSELNGDPPGWEDPARWKTQMSSLVSLNNIEHIVVDVTTAIDTSDTATYKVVGKNVWGGYNSSTKTVTFYTNQLNNKIYLPTNCSRLFGGVTSNIEAQPNDYGATSLISIQTNLFDTSRVHNMIGMFEECSALETLNLSGWDTTSVENMSRMFAGCSSLESINMTGWVPSSVTNMSSMFEGCSAMESLDWRSVNAVSVSDMSWMFKNCTSLETLDLRGWTTTALTNMRGMLYNCTGLLSANFSGWNTSLVDEVDVLNFSFSTSLQYLNLTGWDLAGAGAENMSLSYCGSLCELYSPASVARTADLPVPMFDDGDAQYSNLPGGNVHLRTLPMLADCSSSNFWQTKVAALGVDLTQIEHITVNKSTTLASLTSAGTEYTSVGNAIWAAYNSTTKTVTFYTNGVNDPVFLPENSSLFFGGNMKSGGTLLSGLKTVQTGSFSTALVEHIDGMFMGDSSLQNLDLTGWDLSNVSSVGYFLAGCESLNTLNLSGIAFKSGFAEARSSGQGGLLGYYRDELVPLFTQELGLTEQQVNDYLDSNYAGRVAFFTDLGMDSAQAQLIAKLYSLNHIQQIVLPANLNGATIMLPDSYVVQNGDGTPHTTLIAASSGVTTLVPESTGGGDEPGGPSTGVVTDFVVPTIAFATILCGIAFIAIKKKENA